MRGPSADSGFKAWRVNGVKYKKDGNKAQIISAEAKVSKIRESRCM